MHSHAPDSSYKKLKPRYEKDSVEYKEIQETFNNAIDLLGLENDIENPPVIDLAHAVNASGEAKQSNPDNSDVKLKKVQKIKEVFEKNRDKTLKDLSDKNLENARLLANEVLVLAAAIGDNTINKAKVDAFDKNTKALQRNSAYCIMIGALVGVLLGGVGGALLVASDNDKNNGAEGIVAGSMVGGASVDCLADILRVEMR
jgi:hypothetical protein